MSDESRAEFFAWALPRMGLRAEGFENFGGLLQKRLRRRIRALGLGGIASYRAHLEAVPDEWKVLDELCRVTISRLYRDRAVIDALGATFLPQAARRSEGPVRIWSAGCASGEEPYTMALAWIAHVAPRVPGVTVEIFATDADDVVLERAARGVYASASLREMPRELVSLGFGTAGDDFVASDGLRRMVVFAQQDLRREMPPGDFDVILCRNLVLTYLDVANQRRILAAMAEKLAPRSGILVIGDREKLPDDGRGFCRFVELAPCIFRPD